MGRVFSLVLPFGGSRPAAFSVAFFSSSTDSKAWKPNGRRKPPRGSRAEVAPFESGGSDPSSEVFSSRDRRGTASPRSRPGVPAGQLRRAEAAEASSPRSRLAQPAAQLFFGAGWA